jgi:hypothetical protein
MVVVAGVAERYDDDVNDDDSDSLSTKNADADDNSLYDIQQLYQNAVECIVNSKAVISKLQSQLSMKDALLLTKDTQIMHLEEELIRTKLDLAMTKAMHDHDRFMLQTTTTVPRMNRDYDYEAVHDEKSCRPPSMITAYNTPSSTILAAPISNRRKSSTSEVRDDINRRSDKSSGSASEFMPWPEQQSGILRRKSTGGVRDDVNRNSDESSGSKSGFMSWPEQLPPNGDDMMKLSSSDDNVQSTPNKASFARRATIAAISVRVGVPLSTQLSSHHHTSVSSSIWDRIKKSKSTSTFLQHDDSNKASTTANQSSLVNGRATSFHQDHHKTSTAKQSSLGNSRSTTSNSTWGLLRSGMIACDYQHDNYDEATDRWGLIRKSMNNFTFQQDDYEDNTTARLTSWGTRSNSNSSFGSMINSGRSQQSDSLSLRFGCKNNIPSRRSTVDAAGGPSGGGMRTTSPTKYPRRITFPTESCILEGSGVVVFPETHDDCDQHLWEE